MDINQEKKGFSKLKATGDKRHPACKRKHSATDTSNKRSSRLQRPETSSAKRSRKHNHPTDSSKRCTKRNWSESNEETSSHNPKKTKLRKCRSQPSTAQEAVDECLRPTTVNTPATATSDRRLTEQPSELKNEHSHKTGCNEKSAPPPRVDVSNAGVSFTLSAKQKSDLSMFEIGRVLGTGAYGQVHEARRKSDNKTVALKFLPKKRIPAFKKMDDGESVPEEVFYHSKLHHPAIIKLLDYFWADDYYVMVMEKPTKSCDLMDYMFDRGTLQEDLARKVFKQLLDATIHCEERGVFHRDIKNENIIVDMAGDGVIKLTDFGLSSAMQEAPWYDFKGTLEFCPPEFFSSRQYQATHATVWQLGCVLIEILALYLPYTNPKDALTQPPRVPQNISKEAQDLIVKMLARNGSSRPTLQEIKQHPWLKSH